MFIYYWDKEDDVFLQNHEFNCPEGFFKNKILEELFVYKISYTADGSILEDVFYKANDDSNNLYDILWIDSVRIKQIITVMKFLNESKYYIEPNLFCESRIGKDLSDNFLEFNDITEIKEFIDGYSKLKDVKIVKENFKSLDDFDKSYKEFRRYNYCSVIEFIKDNSIKFKNKENWR